jgi:transposase
LFGCEEPRTGKVITGVADKGNTVTFFNFLVNVSRLYPDQKVIMVVDNVRYHHAKRLKSILERYKHRLELVYLPAYSPDLNPIERIWSYMRKKISHNRYLETMEDRILKFNELMNTFKHENELGKKLTNLIVNI